MQLVNANLCDPITPSSIAGNKYFLLFTSLAVVCGCTCSKKKKRHCVFKKFKRLVENESNHKLKTLHTDRGGEYLSQNFSNFRKKKVSSVNSLHSTCWKINLNVFVFFFFCFF